jgi:fumarate hydratase class II
MLSDDLERIEGGTRPNLKKIREYVERSLMLVPALSPVIGYDKTSLRTRAPVAESLFSPASRPNFLAS